MYKYLEPKAIKVEPGVEAKEVAREIPTLDLFFTVRHFNYFKDVLLSGTVLKERDISIPGRG